MSLITKIRPAGPNHQVVTAVGGGGSYRRKPCAKYPWCQDAVGEFPAAAFKHSASTAYDMSDAVFACHESGLKKTATCAGLLLRGAEHNLAVRLRRMTGLIQDDVADGGHALHDSYRAMAVANGVPPEAPSLAACRD